MSIELLRWSSCALAVAPRRHEHQGRTRWVQSMCGRPVEFCRICAQIKLVCEWLQIYSPPEMIQTRKRRDGMHWFFLPNWKVPPSFVTGSTWGIIGWIKEADTTHPLCWKEKLCVREDSKQCERFWSDSRVHVTRRWPKSETVQSQKDSWSSVISRSSWMNGKFYTA